MLTKFRPARTAVEPEETDDLCDLDVLQDRKTRFKLFGRWRTVEPITNRTFVAFWTASKEYEKGEHDSASYLRIIQTVCKDISLEEIERMTVVQQANLITHITGKIIGRNITEDLEKKNMKVRELGSAS